MNILLLPDGEDYGFYCVCLSPSCSKNYIVVNQNKEKYKPNTNCILLIIHSVLLDNTYENLNDDLSLHFTNNFSFSFFSFLSFQFVIIKFLKSNTNEIPIIASHFTFKIVFCLVLFIFCNVILKIRFIEPFTMTEKLGLYVVLNLTTLHPVRTIRNLSMWKHLFLWLLNIHIWNWNDTFEKAYDKFG